MKSLKYIIPLLCVLISGCVTKTQPTTRQFTAAADGPPDPPCAPNCPTNSPPAPHYMPDYTNGELFCIALTNFIVAVSNTSPFREYALQWSDDLLSWVQITDSQIGTGLNYFNGGSLGFYRAQDVTGDDVIVYPTFGATNSSSSSGCPGNTVGYWVYKPIDNLFPFQPVGTNHTVIDPTSSSDTRVQMVGRFADIHCGSLPLTLSTPDPYYSLEVFFKTTMMGTNYPLILKGFIVRTN